MTATEVMQQVFMGLIQSNQQDLLEECVQAYTSMSLPTSPTSSRNCFPRAWSPRSSFCRWYVKEISCWPSGHVPGVGNLLRREETNVLRHVFASAPIAGAGVLRGLDSPQMLTLHLNCMVTRTMRTRPSTTSRAAALHARMQSARSWKQRPQNSFSS